MQLQGKVALVTGAKGGIGKVIAKRLALAGADLIINDLEISDADPVIRECKDLGVDALPAPADICRKDRVEEMVRQALDRYPRIDILVNNAGIFPAAPLLEITEAEWDRVIGVNLKGTFLVAQSVARFAMVPQHYGRIVNIASVDGKAPAPGIAHYAAAKAGVISLTRSFALELSRYHITANAVAPGWVESEAVLKGDRWQEAVKKIPMQRLGRLAEIAEAVLFLAGDAVAYVNGATLNVNGGLLMD